MSGASARPWRAAVREQAEEGIALLQRLVAIDTSNPPGRGCLECVGLLREWAESAGLRCAVHPVPGAPEGLPRQVLRIEAGEGRDAFYLHGHYDVVPAAAEMFRPTRRGNRVLGRGSSDMKGGIVSMLLATRALAPALGERGAKLVVHLVPDEETGGRWGADWLATSGLIDPAARGMLLAEPTGGSIWNAHRGALSVMVHVRGRTAHVGRPEAGSNAVEASLPLLQAASELRAELSPAAVLVIGGRVEGPASANSVPERFSFSLDCRFDPSLSLEALQWRVEEAIDQANTAAADVRLEVFQRAAPSATPAGEPLSRRLAACIEAVTGETARFEVCPGVLESRHYAARGVPALGYGPGLLEVSHGPDEYVLVDDVLAGAEVIAATVDLTLSEESSSLS